MFKQLFIGSYSLALANFAFFIIGDNSITNLLTVSYYCLDYSKCLILFSIIFTVVPFSYFPLINFNFKGFSSEVANLTFIFSDFLSTIQAQWQFFAKSRYLSPAGLFIIFFFIIIPPKTHELLETHHFSFSKFKSNRLSQPLTSIGMILLLSFIDFPL